MNQDITVYLASIEASLGRLAVAMEMLVDVFDGLATVRQEQRSIEDDRAK